MFRQIRLADGGIGSQNLRVCVMPKRSYKHGLPERQEIGARIRTLRVDRHISQTRLGELLGVSCQQVQNYENGHTGITIARMKRIAEVMDCHPCEICGCCTELEMYTLRSYRKSRAL
jgi:DNA-binding transcriptional regulator YiaG